MTKDDVKIIINRNIEKHGYPEDGTLKIKFSNNKIIKMLRETNIKIV